MAVGNLLHVIGSDGVPITCMDDVGMAPHLLIVIWGFLSFSKKGLVSHHSGVMAKTLNKFDFSQLS